MRPIWMLEDADVANGPETVLRRLNIRIDEGEFVAVVGRNGSGKSTLLRVLGGLAPVTRGKLQADPEMKRLVRTVLQNPDAQIVGETVFEDVAFGLENIAAAPEDMPERVRAALSLVGLNVRGDEPVDHLSGGQKQLLCIAGAIVTGTRLLLLDEPAAMLDPVSKSAVLGVAERLHKSGATIVWATQAMDEVGFAGRVIALAAGEVAFDGTPERFFYGDGDDAASCPCLALGFRLPYAIETAHRLLKAGFAASERPVRNEQLLKAVTGLCR